MGEVRSEEPTCPHCQCETTTDGDWWYYCDLEDDGDWVIVDCIECGESYRLTLVMTPSFHSVEACDRCEEPKDDCICGS